MSSATRSLPSIPTAATSTCHRVVDTVGRLFAASVRAGAFWAAVLLPLVILASLPTGIAAASPAAVLCLVGLNIVCAVIGHDHTP